MIRIILANLLSVCLLSSRFKALGEKCKSSACESGITRNMENLMVKGAVVGGRSVVQVDGIKRAWKAKSTEVALADLEGIIP